MGISKIECKNRVRIFLLILAPFVPLLFVYLKYGLDNIRYNELSNDFYFSMILMSSIIGGVLFTGIGLLIPAFSNDRIKRLYVNNYLNQLIYSAFIGVLSSIVVIIISYTIIIMNMHKLFLPCIYFMVMNVVMFLSYVRQLWFVIGILKKDI